MSDGPHRSLPMRRHWQDLTERAAKAAYSPDQVSEALPYALRRDIMEAPIDTICDILGGGKQDSLFVEEKIQQLEAAREMCRGSAAGNSLIDCAIDAVINGLAGDTACLAALETTLDDIARSALRGIEEHCQREASARSAQYIRGRLNAARQQCNIKGIAIDLMATGKPKHGAIRLPRHSGLDEGPTI